MGSELPKIDSQPSLQDITFTCPRCKKTYLTLDQSGCERCGYLIKPRPQVINTNDDCY